eukprot:m.388982 g.388982  ORF g.388982 m.388982 type:complete len:169 (-) comp21045_c2_seq33:606-1112(-)
MTQIALQVYGRTAFDYAAETTSFIMLHSPLDRLKKREEVCRVLHPLLTRAQKQHRPLTERKAIIIAQVAQFSDPFKCRMMDYNTPQSNGNSRPGSVRSSASKGPSSSSSVPKRSSSGSTGRPRAATGPKRSSTSSSTGRPSTGTTRTKTTVPRGPNLTAGSRTRTPKQ